MSKLKIYHTIKGGAEVMTVDEAEKTNAAQRVKQIQADGGFWSNDTFIPWPSITYVEYVRTPDDAPAPVAKPVAAAAAPIPPK